MPKSSKYEYKAARINEHDYTKDIEDTGHRIRERREALGLSLDSLAGIISGDKSGLSRIENGTRIPKYDMILKLCDALNTTPAKLCPNRFYDSGPEYLTEIHRRLMNLPTTERATAIRYINALLDGLQPKHQGSSH